LGEKRELQLLDEVEYSIIGFCNGVNQIRELRGIRGLPPHKTGTKQHTCGCFRKALDVKRRFRRALTSGTPLGSSR
jgi:hypothetical protein